MRPVARAAAALPACAGAGLPSASGAGIGTSDLITFAAPEKITA